MSDVIQRSSFHSDVAKVLIKKWFGDAYKDYEPVYPKMMKVEKSDMAFDVDALVIGMGSLQVKDEANSLVYDHAKQGYTPRYLHATYALGFKITMEMMEDGTAMKNAKRFTEMLKKASLHSKDIVAAQIINRAATSGFTMDGGDGVVLASASHPTFSGNQSNLLTGNPDISEAAVEAMRLMIRQARDQRNLRMDLKPVKLLIPTELEPEANRIVNSKLRVATANNDLNFINQYDVFPGGIVVNPYLTDVDAWGIVTDADDGLKFKMRKDDTIDADNEFDTKNACYSLVTRFSAGWSDWRGYYHSSGT